MILRPNQQNAINKTLENDFKSGIHFHATGSGKSIIALNLIIKFNELQKSNKNHNSLIFWITEKKSILKEQFSSKKLKETGFDELNKDFLILNYSDYKHKKWYEVY